MSDTRIPSILWTVPQNLSESEKQQARENMGVSSDGGAIVIMNVPDIMSSVTDPDEGYVISIPPTPELWEQCIDAILAGNVPAFNLSMPMLDGFGALAICTDTFTKPDDMTLAEYKEMLLEDSVNSTLHFTATLSLYGGMINDVIAFYIVPGFGFFARLPVRNV